jgi:hypothetical protein
VDKSREQSPAISVSTCHPGDRTTKLATAGPSCGGLCYGPIFCKLLTNDYEIAEDEVMKVVIPQRGYIAATMLAGAISAAIAQPHETVKLNESAFAFAAELIKKGHFIADRKGAWSEHRPSAEEENEFIRLHGFGEYAKWHLGIDPRFGENTKQRYKFPYGDFKNVHRCGLLAIRARARQYGYVEIENAAARLERTIQDKSQIDADFHKITNSSVFHPCKSVALDLPGP